MLILRRRAGESITIGEGVEIEVLEIGPSRVKLGVRARADVKVQRTEVLQISKQNRCAATLTTEGRALLARNLSDFFSRIQVEPADKDLEARYSGHPLRKENPGPA